MGEENAGVNSKVGGEGRVTITEAATLLGVHPNTVRNRVKAGVYKAEKIFTENGFTWMLDPDSLVNALPPKDSQQVPSQTVNTNSVTPMELVQDLLRPFVEDLGRVREELGAERERREQAERERDELRDRLVALQASHSTPNASDEATPHPDTVDAQGATGEPERKPWWVRWFGG